MNKIKFKESGLWAKSIHENFYVDAGEVVTGLSDSVCAFAVESGKAEMVLEKDLEVEKDLEALPPIADKKKAEKKVRRKKTTV